MYKKEEDDYIQSELDVISEVIQKYHSRYFSVDRIILFGNFARKVKPYQNIICEGNQLVKYVSSYDILIVTRKEGFERHMTFKRRVLSELSKKYHMNHGVNIQIETSKHLQSMLEEKRYYYLNIMNNGLMLYDSGRVEFSYVSKVDKKELQKNQLSDLELGMNLVKGFLESSQNSLDSNNIRHAMFSLHQAFENLLGIYLILKRGYRMKTHDLELLYKELLKNTHELNDLFDLSFEGNDNRILEVVNKAYGDARYKRNYSIDYEDIIYLYDKLNIGMKKVGVLSKKIINNPM